MLVTSIARHRIATAAVALLLAAPWGARAEEFPAMGVELEWNWVELVRFNTRTLRFGSVEEKTPSSKMFRTAGDAPQHPTLPLFNVTTDNGKQGSPALLVTTYGTHGLALDLSGATVDFTGAGANTGDRTNSEYADATIEVATGPLTFDPFLHGVVRDAIGVFKKSLLDVCAAHGEGHTNLIPDTAVLADYNRALVAYVEHNKVELAKHSKAGEYAHWTALLTLQPWDGAKDPANRDAADFHYFFRCRTRGGDTNAQATFGVPLTRFDQLGRQRELAFLKADKAKALVTKLDTDKKLSDDQREELGVILGLWGKFAECADTGTFRNKPRAPLYYTKCQQAGWAGCYIACNKAGFSPLLPHVSACALYQAFRATAPEGSLAVAKLESAEQKTNLVRDMGVTLRNWRERVDLLTTPFASSADACTAAFGRQGLTNQDAATIAPLQLRTRSGLKLGAALEERSIRATAAEVSPLSARDDAGAKYLEDIRTNVSDSPKVSCVTASTTAIECAAVMVEAVLKEVKANRSPGGITLTLDSSRDALGAHKLVRCVLAANELAFDVTHQDAATGTITVNRKEPIGDLRPAGVEAGAKLTCFD
jgi:hypothetical protein